MKPLPQCHTVGLKSADGKQTRSAAFIGVVEATKSLYRPVAFGGALYHDSTEDANSAAERLAKELVEEGADVVIPLTHQAVKLDKELTAKHLPRVPVVLGAHDHDVVEHDSGGCFLCKGGMDAVNAAIIDFEWSDGAATEPSVRCFYFLF